MGRKPWIQDSLKAQYWRATTSKPEMICCPTCLGHGEIVFTGRGSTFDAWWQFYPRKEAKGDAERAHKKALVTIRADKCMTRGGASDFLIEKCKEYSVAKAGQDKKYIPLPATWLNGKRWDDDPAMWVDDKSVVADRQFEMSKKAHEKQVQGFKDAEKSAATHEEKSGIFRKWRGK